MGKDLGECPHCHAEVTVGRYGPYCTNRCGMMLKYAFGIKLDENQVWNLLAWRPIYVKGIKRKDGKTVYGISKTVVFSSKTVDYGFYKNRIRLFQKP